MPFNQVQHMTHNEEINVAVERCPDMQRIADLQRETGGKATQNTWADFTDLQSWFQGPLHYTPRVCLRMMRSRPIILTLWTTSCKLQPSKTIRRT